VVASDVHGLDQRVFVRPDALPEEAIAWIRDQNVPER
jgi:hypothetical protein